MARAQRDLDSSGLPRSLQPSLYSQEHELERVVPLAASSLPPQATTRVSETYYVFSISANQVRSRGYHYGVKPIQIISHQLPTDVRGEDEVGSDALQLASTGGSSGDETREELPES